MFDRRGTPCPMEAFLVLYLRISTARVFPLRSFNLPSDHFSFTVQDPNCTAVNGNYNKPQWNLEQCLYCIPRAHLTLGQQQVVLQHVQICRIPTATAHFLSHTASFTVLCVVTYVYSVNCLNLTPLSPPFFHFKKIGTEAKILSSGRHNRVPHRRLVVIFDAGSKARYQILTLRMNVSTVNCPP